MNLLHIEHNTNTKRTQHQHKNITKSLQLYFKQYRKLRAYLLYIRLYRTIHHSLTLLKMGRWLPEICWTDSKINKIVIIASSWSFILFAYIIHYPRIQDVTIRTPFSSTQYTSKQFGQGWYKAEVSPTITFTVSGMLITSCRHYYKLRGCKGSMEY